LSASRSLFQSATGSKRSSLLPHHDQPKSQPTSDTEDNDKDKSHQWLTSSIRNSWIAEHKPDSMGADDGATLNEKEQVAFRNEFSLPDSEGLSVVVSGYLLRTFPSIGRVYLSDNYICFKSKLKLYGTPTKVIVPLTDIEQVTKHKGTRFYVHGLSILTKTDEEIFFEFWTSETRNTILNTLRDRTTPEAQEKRRKQRAQAIAETPSIELDDPMGFRVIDSTLLREGPVFVESGFKPSRPMHITCLTIGSRGDVQPYIALCKRLMLDGHSCRIATHAEYKDWVEGHGIEFGLVGVSLHYFLD